jgi:hypothetical protein
MSCKSVSIVLISVTFNRAAVWFSLIGTSLVLTAK